MSKSNNQGHTTEQRRFSLIVSSVCLILGVVMIIIAVVDAL